MQRVPEPSAAVQVKTKKRAPKKEKTGNGWLPDSSGSWWRDWRYSIGILAAPLFFFPQLVPDIFGIQPDQFAQIVKFVSGALLLLPFGIVVENVTDFFEDIFRRYPSPKHDEQAPSLFAGLIHATLTNISFLSLTVFTLTNALSQGEEAQTRAREIVQLAIAGGLIVNLLFNLGFAIFVGGLGGRIFGRKNEQGKRERHSGRLGFSKELANQDVEMITIAIIVLALPSLALKLSVTAGFLGESNRILSTKAIPTISIVTSVVLLLIYICYIFWTVLKVGDNVGTTAESMMEQVQEKVYRAIHRVTRDNRVQFHQALNAQDGLKEDIERVISKLDETDEVAREEAEHREEEEKQMWWSLPRIIVSIPLIPLLLLAGIVIDILSFAFTVIRSLFIGVVRLPRTLWGGGKGLFWFLGKLPGWIVAFFRGCYHVARFIFTDRKYVGRFATLILGTVAVVLISDQMATSIEGGLVEGLGLNRFFVGLIVIPIASGLVDIIAATGKAWEDDAQYSLAITAGSAVQVALFVAPVLVLASQVFVGALPDINLVFGFFILAVFALIVYYYQVMTVDGETTWFEGAQLLAIFIGVAIVIFLTGQFGVTQ